jgi:hypothetical protein
VVTLTILTGGSIVDYFRHWRTFPGHVVAGAIIANLVLQILVTTMLVMPVVTTIVLYHQSHARWRMRALVACMVLTTAFGALAAHFTSDIPLATWRRLTERTKMATRDYRACVTAHHGDRAGCTDKNGAFVALREALNDVYVARQHGEVSAADAHQIAATRLATFYAPDEADAFELYDGEGVLVLYVKFDRKTPIWLGRDDHRLITEPSDLPPGARARLFKHSR